MNARGPLEALADLLDERQQHEDRERQHRDEVGEDHARDRPADPVPVERRGEWNAVRHLGDQQRQEVEEQHRVLRREAAPGQHVGGGEAEEQRERRHRDGHRRGDRQHVGQLELAPRVCVPLGREGAGQRRREPALGERGDDDVAHDADEIEREAQHEQEHRQPPDAPTHQRLPAIAVTPAPGRGRRARAEDGSPVRRNSLGRDSRDPPSPKGGRAGRSRSSAARSSRPALRAATRLAIRRSRGTHVRTAAPSHCAQSMLISVCPRRRWRRRSRRDGRAARRRWRARAAGRGP